MRLNRIIILGNGFDLAHQLKTKYSDFIKDYYLTIQDSYFKDEFLEFVIPGYLFNQMNSLEEMTRHMERALGPMTLMSPSMNIHFKRKLGIILHNKFFYLISKKSESKWVDIEVDYYERLLELIDKNPHNKALEEIRKLNNEVNMISEKFEQYLVEKVVPFIGSKYNVEIGKLFDNKIAKNSEEFFKFLKEFSKSNLKTIQPELRKKFNENNSLSFDETLILNFNYTDTALKLYSENINRFKVINIHGSLRDASNPINLGFGDEMHSRYSEIEEANENEYLRLMKSFAYTSTDNYRQLFDFVEGEAIFQVQIMGHSCGISDRTLLNAIFENENCKSIKVFYHQESESNDNYSDIVRNISRHFNKKLIMRNKIVNKTLTTSLPQYVE